MPRKNGPRSSIPSERLVHPWFGARHKIPYDSIRDRKPLINDELDFFFTDLRNELNKVLPQEEVIIEKQPLDGSAEHQPIVRHRPLFRIYDDPDRLGLTIFERRMTNIAANRARIRWSRHDIGRIRGGIQDEIARNDLADIPLEAEFVTAVRLPNNSDNKKARKIGLVMEQESALAEFMVSEHEICFDSLSGVMAQRFTRAYETFLPHWTVVRIDKKVGQAAMNQAVKVVQNLLPIKLQIEPISFFSHQDVEP